TNVGALFNESSKTLEINFYSKELNKSLTITQMINTQPKNEEKFSKAPFEEKVKLINGTEAIYIYNKPENIPNHLRFVMGDVCYLITIHQKENTSLKELVDIANSMIT